MQTTTVDNDSRRLVLLTRILRGIRESAEIARRLERDREELLSLATVGADDQRAEECQ